jgi:RNA polymerase sigma-70 factor (ECF subfamily)
MGPETLVSDASSEERFRELYASTYADVLRFVLRRAHASHAEDVTAEVFTVAWRRLAQVPASPGEAKAWLLGVARHTLQNSGRGRQRYEALAVRIAQDFPRHVDSDSDTEVLARRLDLAAAWPRLSPADQEAIALIAWEELSSAQAAAVIGISAVAFRLRLSRARRKLRRHLGEATGRASETTPQQQIDRRRR